MSSKRNQRNRGVMFSLTLFFYRPSLASRLLRFGSSASDGGVFSSGNIPFKPFVTVTLLSVWAGLISRMLLSLYQAQQRVGAYVIIEGLGFVLSVIVGLVLVVQYRMGAYGQILGGFVSQLALMVIAAILVFRDWFTPRMAWRHVYNALIFGLPLVPHLLSGWALTFVDRIMLEHFV